MKYSIRKEYAFEAAHHLPLVPDGHQCKRVHGHSYRVEVEISSEGLRDGFVVDFAVLDSVMKPLVAGLDHQDLNEFFENPTAEIIAVWFFDRLSSALERPEFVNIERVTVYETAKASASVLA